eukprot:1270972-Rhodomonas_salina.1
MCPQLLRAGTYASGIALSSTCAGSPPRLLTVAIIAASGSLAKMSQRDLCSLDIVPHFLPLLSPFERTSAHLSAGRQGSQKRLVDWDRETVDRRSRSAFASIILSDKNPRALSCRCLILTSHVFDGRGRGATKERLHVTVEVILGDIDDSGKANSGEGACNEVTEETRESKQHINVP